MTKQSLAGKAHRLLRLRCPHLRHAGKIKFELDNLINGIDLSIGRSTQNIEIIDVMDKYTSLQHQNRGDEAL